MTTTVVKPPGASDRRIWVVMPTYNEVENIRSIAPAILQHMPGANLLVVDDNSPDRTGEVADELARITPRIHVLHRPAKTGLGKAYIDGFRYVLTEGAEVVVQMDADWSHDPRYLPQLVAALDDQLPGQKAAGVKPALVIGSRYVPGGDVVNWGILRKLVSRGGSMFARIVLNLPVRDLTSGFKAFPRSTLAALPLEELHSGGYVFMIETTFMATRRGERVAEIPIVFVDRRRGKSKLSRRIIFEAFVIVLRLRWDALRGRLPARRAGDSPP